MATITTSETISIQDRGSTIRYRFKYVLDNGEVHFRNAWVASSVNEATERTARGVYLLEELAEAEANQIIGGG